MHPTVRGVFVGAVLLAACAGRPRSIDGHALPGDAGAVVMADAASPPEAPVAVVSLPLPQSASGALCSMDRIAQLERSIMDADASTSARVTSTPWDHVTPPARLDRVTERFALTNRELEALEKNGFVVPDRLAFDSYTLALHELYQSELPLYVSIDAILHSVFVSHDELVERVELARVLPSLDHILTAMQQKLAGNHDYPAEVEEDLDLYLTVARSLLGGRAPKSGTRAAALVERVERARELSEESLFGRQRMIDFSEYAPRGHYAKSQRLARFFRAAMWVSRLELNLVSRSSRSSQPGATPNPEETPREAVDAMALADLADAAGVLAEIGVLDRGWAALAGGREDVPLERLSAIVKAQGGGKTLTIPGSFEAMKKAIGNDFKRTTAVHYMPQGSTDLPVIATMLGPRIVPDSAATRPIVHGALPDRYDIGAADVAYLLGHDRAKKYLETDIAKFPGLPAALQTARAIAMKPASGVDVYGAWLDTVKALSASDAGTVPSYMTTDAFRDLRMDEAVAGYAQIKHNYVLIAGQPYDEGACEVPDAFVDPVLPAWDALVTYAARAKSAFRELDPKDGTTAQAYFERLGTIAKVLRAIAREELAGRALSPAALAFLSAVVEIHSEDIGTGFATRYDGWYFDLFLSRPGGTTLPPPGREGDAPLKYAGFIADFYTSVNSGLVAYVGAKAPRLGIFVVDTSGPPRIVVGPVADAFEHHAPLLHRLADADVRKLETARAPWAASYEVAAPPEPPLVVETEIKDADDRVKGHSAAVDVVLRSTRALGEVKVVLMDHNRHPVATLQKDVADKRVRFSFPPRVQRIPAGRNGTEMVMVTVGNWSGSLDLFGHYGAAAGFGGMTPRPPPP